jgi:16S rRNA (guanine966-N2)-methyltransferase
MRIVGGELRGRRLAAPPARSAAVRPTADRVREAVFSILGEAVGGASVLDLFCGTGALAIEALSRGAARATLVDTDPRLARRNVDELGLGGRAEIVRGDAVRFLGRRGERFDLVFCDPPYNIADRLEGNLDSLIPTRLQTGGRLIVESSARRPLELAGLPVAVERRYGEALVRIYGKEGGEAAPEGES